MAKIDAQSVNAKNCLEFFENVYDFVSESNSHIDSIKHLIQSLESADFQNSFDSYSQAFNAYKFDLLDIECLEIFIESLLKKAREFLLKNIINLDYIFCIFCGDVIKDPITFKCGHTFSKKCALLKSKNGMFNCCKCNEIIPSSHLSEMKSNILVFEFISKVWNIPEDLTVYKEGSSLISDCSLYKLFSIFINCEGDSFLDQKAFCSRIQSPSPKYFLQKGDMLVNLEKYYEAIYFYLIYCAFVPKAVEAKTKAVVFFHKILLSQRNLFKSINGQLSIKSLILKYKEKERNNKSNMLHVKNFSKDNVKVKDDLSLLIYRFCKNIEQLSKVNLLKNNLKAFLFERSYYECSLCIQLFLEPVTTPCGHTFCRTCLNRWLDHQPSCPLCKSDLSLIVANQERCVDDCIERIIACVFSEDYFERRATYIKEMQELFNTDRRNHPSIPLFVCTIAFPSVSCPLHIYEPRYRLMMRQCIESGSYKFGMCAFIDNDISEYGTLLVIENVHYFPDGRSVVHTVGCKRFRVLKKGEQDGYNTGVVEFLKDEVLTVNEEFVKLHDLLYQTALSWFDSLPANTKRQIISHFGSMPEKESYYSYNPNGPSWIWWILAILPINSKSKIHILSMTSLKQRLIVFKNIFIRLKLESFKNSLEQI